MDIDEVAHHEDQLASEAQQVTASAPLDEQIDCPPNQTNPPSLGAQPSIEKQTVREHVRSPPPQIYEPAPTGRSKKRRGNAAANKPEETIVLVGEPIEPTSERLRLRSWRPVKLSSEDKASKITLDDTQLQASSSLGYKMVRATHGAYSGTWYFEVRVGALGSTGACRLGWATIDCELQAPVGVDEHSFAYRSVEGSKVYKSLREPYGQPYTEGDVIGCILHMPPGGRRIERTVDDVVKYKRQLYFTKDEHSGPPQPLPGSFVAFTLNGKLQGKAYGDLTEGTYYPAVSLYTHAHHNDAAVVTVNFGDAPFAFPPPKAQELELPAGRDPQPFADIPGYVAPVTK